MKLRAVLKWTGAGLCALIFAAWFSSRWFGVWLVHVSDQREYVAGMRAGQAWVVWWDHKSQPMSPPGLHLHADRRTSQWMWTVWHTALKDHGAQVSLHAPLAVLALPVAWLFYRDRRRVRWAGTGRCVGCGYDLSGLPQGCGRAVCPECGREQ